MSFYDVMDRPLSTLASLGFSAIFVLSGCGDASAPGIDGPGVHGTGVNAGSGKDAAPDHGNGYQDPSKQDGGCTAPNLVCSGVCVAVDSDPTNCGACGNACLAGDAVCNAGKCACASIGEDYCAGVGCMDVSSDFQNCGACGHACDPANDQSCTGGTCVPNDP